MPGILGTKAGLLQDIALLTQIVVIFILNMGYKYVRDKKLRTHGRTMAVAVTLHTITILLVMVPSFITNSGTFLMSVFSPMVFVTWIHIFVGTLSEILGIFLIAEWRFRPPPKMTCAKRRQIMKPLFTLWTFSLTLGIAFYVYYYLL